MSKQTLRRYILTESVLKQRYLKRGWNLPLVCYKCGRIINIGEKIVRKRSKIYHETCYEATFIDLPDLDPEDEFFLEFGYYPNNSTIASSTIPTTISTNI